MLCEKRNCYWCEYYRKSDKVCLLKLFEEINKELYPRMKLSIRREDWRIKREKMERRNMLMRMKRRQRKKEARKKNKLRAKCAPATLKAVGGDFSLDMLKPRMRFKLPIYLWNVVTSTWLTCSEDGILDVANKGDVVVGRAYNRHCMHEMYTVDRQFVMSEWEDENKGLSWWKWSAACRMFKGEAMEKLENDKGGE